MNGAVNARATFNVWLRNYLAANLAGWSFLTGDEPDPGPASPVLAVTWMGRETLGRKPENRMRLVRVDMRAPYQVVDTWTLEVAVAGLLRALNIEEGGRREAYLPFYDYTAGEPGVLMPTTLTVRFQGDQGFEPLPGVQQSTRRQQAVFEVEYRP